MNCIQCSVAVTLMAISTFARAEGAIEINGACVASGCFDGDAPGFPVELNAAGLYRLTSRIDGTETNPIGQGSFIEILSDGVTLDLGGHSISGPIRCSGDTPTCSFGAGLGTAINTDFNLSNIVIRNGTIRGMGARGIFIGSGAINFRIEDIRVSDTKGTGITTGSGSGEIVRVQASNNELRGLSAVGQVIVRDSTFINNGSEGALAPYCDNNLFDLNGDSSGAGEADCQLQLRPSLCGSAPC